MGIYMLAGTQSIRPPNWSNWSANKPRWWEALNNVLVLFYTTQGQLITYDFDFVMLAIGVSIIETAQFLRESQGVICRS